MDTLALSTLTTAEAAEQIARRQVSSVELVAACLGRIEALEPRLNCFITVCREEALAAAREADAALAAGGGGGPLHGVPVAVKDNVEPAGVRATGGSRILADHAPADAAPAWGACGPPGPS